MPSTRLFDIHPLFDEVQSRQNFVDGKTFVDCIPRRSLDLINKEYLERREQKDFDLGEFVLENFITPMAYDAGFVADRNQSVEHHIELLWDLLTRQPGEEEAGSLIPLPYPYIVPGGRFDEIYYWDSYFTMLGLKASGKTEMLENMVRNFSYLIDSIGYIPNGNRTYYIGRSQPPFYALMVKLLAEARGKEMIGRYLPQLEKEYRFWTKGVDELHAGLGFAGHLVRMPGGEIMNRYWDYNDTARPEAYREDKELARVSATANAEVYRHLRAGAASGWDFSSRWFHHPGSFASIHTTDIIPVDLNCLLFFMEQTLAEAHELKGNHTTSLLYYKLAEKRDAAIQAYCWDADRQYYVDYDMQQDEQSNSLSLAAVFPLFFEIASSEQAAAVAKRIEKDFLKAGGLVTTLEETGQQWDAPNGWAPLQWIAINGLEKYGHNALARDIAERWIRLNKEVFYRTGKLMEKYNVVDTHLEAGGGEYPGQDGFGWTNGVLLALIRKYE